MGQRGKRGGSIEEARGEGGGIEEAWRRENGGKERTIRRSHPVVNVLQPLPSYNSSQYFFIGRCGQCPGLDGVGSVPVWTVWAVPRSGRCWQCPGLDGVGSVPV